MFRSTNPAAPGLYAIRSDGSGEGKRLTEGDRIEVPFSFSPDGKRLVMHQTGHSGSYDLFTRPVQADAGPGALGLRLEKGELFLGTPFDERYAVFSPDGHWLAYTSNESGKYEVYVRPYPGPGGRWPVSTGGGILPVWRRDGRELLFETLDRRVMAVSYAASGDSFAPGQPRLWTNTRLRATGSSVPNYDLARTASASQRSSRTM